MRQPIPSGFAIFFLIVFLSLFLLTWQTKIMSDPIFLTKTLKQANVYEKIPEAIGNIQMEGNNTLNYVGFIKTLVKTTKPEQIQSMIEKSIYSATSYLKGEIGNDAAIIDFKDIKKSFIAGWSKTAPSIYTSTYGQLKICSSAIKALGQDGQTNPITCQASDLSAEKLSSIVSQSDPVQLVNSIPDSIYYKDLNPNNLSLLEKIKTGFKYNNTVYLASIVGSILMILLIIGLGFPDWRSILGHLGWPLILTAGPIYLTNLFGKQGISLLDSFWKFDESSLTGQIIKPILTSINQNISSTTMQITAILFFAGVVMLITSLFIPKFEPRVIPPGFGKNEF